MFGLLNITANGAQTAVTMNGLVFIYSLTVRFRLKTYTPLVRGCDFA